MTVFLVRTYTVKPDKLQEHNEWGKKLIALLKKHPGQFADVQSMRVFSHKYGGAVGAFTAMWKFQSLAQVEAFEQGFREDKDEVALRSEFMDLLLPGSYSQCIWESVRAVNRKAKPKSKKP